MHSHFVGFVMRRLIWQNVQENLSSYIKLFNAVMSTLMSMQLKKLDGHSYSCYDWGQFYYNAKLMKKKKKTSEFPFSLKFM